jgi:hypothetical protein
MKATHKTIPAYHRALAREDKAICDALKGEIEKALPQSEAKVWHGHPVWFLDGNPIVGYHKLKDAVRLLFWSGQSFEEEGLAVEGTFRAAEARYVTLKDLKLAPLRRWLKKSKTIQWDYKNIVKRRGVLEKIGSW